MNNFDKTKLSRDYIIQSKVLGDEKRDKYGIK